MNSYRRGLRNGVLVNPKLFILEKFNLAPPTIGWSTWSNLVKLVKNLYYLVRVITFFTPILKCIAGKDTEYVLREVHEGICGNHIGARALAGKVLRQGYYWPTILRDATDLVRICKICQEHAKISRLPYEPFISIISPWPFQLWGLDILGPLPIGKGQCKFIIVAVDYFTKWAEAEPLATIT